MLQISATMSNYFQYNIIIYCVWPINVDLPGLWLSLKAWCFDLLSTITLPQDFNFAIIDMLYLTQLYGPCNCPESSLLKVVVFFTPILESCWIWHTCIYITIFSVQRSLFGLILFNLLLEFMLYLTYFSLFLVQRVLSSSILFDFQLIPMSMLITSLAQGSLRSSSRRARVPSLPLVKLMQTLSWKKGISWPLGNTSLRSEVLRATLMVRSMGLVTTWEWYIWGKIFL